MADTPEGAALEADPANNSGDNSGRVMVVQPHGGALRRGGPNPNAGRKPDRIRKAARVALAARIGVLETIADGDPFLTESGDGVQVTRAKPGERVSAIKLLKEIALGSEVNTGDVRRRLKLQARMIYELLPLDVADALLDRLHREVWR